MSTGCSFGRCRSQTPGRLHSGVAARQSDLHQLPTEVQHEADAFPVDRLRGLPLFAAQTGAQAQVAGTTTIGVAALQVKAVAVGWSARKQILGRTVYNETGETWARSTT